MIIACLFNWSKQFCYAPHRAWSRVRRTVNPKPFCRLRLVVQGSLVCKWQNIQWLVERFCVTRFSSRRYTSSIRPWKGVVEHFTSSRDNVWSVGCPIKQSPFFHGLKNRGDHLLEWGYSLFQTGTTLGGRSRRSGYTELGKKSHVYLPQYITGATVTWV